MSSNPTPDGPDEEFDGVTDPSDYNQRRRIKDLQDVRRRVFEQYRHALDLQSRGQISDELAAKIIRQAVTEYALESEHVIQSHLPEDDDPDTWTTEQQAAHKTWQEKPLGSLTMQTRTLTFTGVKSFIDAPRVLADSWQETTSHPVHGVQTTVERERYELPIEVSIETYRALNEFWRQFGLDLEMDKKLPHDMI